MFSKNGIIKKAEQARDMYKTGEQSEKDAMEELEDQYDEIVFGKAGTKVDDKPAGWTSTKVIPILDGGGATIPLPEGFYYVGGNIKTGIVISDKEGDKIDASGTSMGNQFVWIPVKSEADLERTNFDSNGKPTSSAPSLGLGYNVTNCTEPYASGYSTEESEYDKMRTQVLKYGGFYIGRYEAGINSTTKRTKATVAQEVVSKKGVAPYNYVPWGKSMSDVDTAFAPSKNNADKVSTHGAVYLAKNFARQEGYTSVISTLCYGCEWDAMCRYIGDANRKATATGSVQLTGATSGDISKNIYDLAGNCQEWTMEGVTTGCRVLRGGWYSGGAPVSDRSNDYPDSCYFSRSFRPTLYIK